MNSNKKVVHMTTVHHPYDPRIYYKQCMSLHHAGYDVSLIAQQTKEQPETSKTQKPIHHIPIKTYTSRWKRMLFGTFATYKKARKINANIYVFHDPELLLVGWLLKRKDNVVIYDIHEDYVTSLLQKKYLPSLFRRFIAQGYRIVEKLLTKNMALSLAEKYYKEIYPKGKCILNYPIFNSTNGMKSNDNNIESKLLYTGNVTEDRGALIHAEIPKFYNQVDVHFVGKCSQQLGDLIYETVGEKSSQINIEGIDRFIEKDEMERTYTSRRWLAGIAIFPPTDHYMKKELTKFFEYMNASLPIICSNFPTWQQFIDKYECGIAVDPYNEDEIIDAIKKLHYNTELNNQMGNNGKKAVEEKLNWKIEEQKMLKWYDQLMEEHR